MKFTLFLMMIFFSAFGPSAFALGPIAEFVNTASGIDPVDYGASYGKKTVSDVVTTDANQTYQESAEQFDGALKLGDHWNFGPKIRHRAIKSLAKVPIDGQPLPTDLWDARIKFHYQNPMAQLAKVGVVYELGQATDKLYQSYNEVVYRMTPYIGLGPEPRTMALLFVNFANDRKFANKLPLPGFTYGFRASPKWGMTLGFPVFHLWAEPFSWATFNLTTELIGQIDCKLILKPKFISQLYLRGLIEDEVYKRYGRIKAASQVVYTYTQYAIGIKQKFGPLELDLMAALESNRYYLEVEDVLKARGSQLLRLGNGRVAQLSAGMKF